MLFPSIRSYNRNNNNRRISSSSSSSSLLLSLVSNHNLFSSLVLLFVLVLFLSFGVVSVNSLVSFHSPRWIHQHQHQQQQQQQRRKISSSSSSSTVSLLSFGGVVISSTSSIRSRCGIVVGRMSSLLSVEEMEGLLEVAMDASKKAGDIIIGNAGGAEVMKTKANSRDLLTLIDPLCEKTIQETILTKYPNHDFLGEEDVPPGKEASTAALHAKLNNNNNPYLWIVDPIDGTSNFVHGMPLCMPSIAVAYQGEVVVGVIYDPHRDEMFTAMKGQGAKMNGKKIQVGEQTELGDAIVAMGSPPAAESLEMSLRALPNLMPKVRTIRMLGSAALMLAWVANGRLTAYWEYDLSSWDVAAGSLLITEAGGKFTDLQDNPYNLRIRKICASNNGGNIHSDILNTLHQSNIH